MRVRVKDAALKRGFQYEAGDAPRDDCPAPCRQVGNIRRLASIDTRFGKHPSLRVLFDDLRDGEPSLVREDLTEEPLVRRFVTVVQFRPERVAELSNQAAGVVLLEHREARSPLIDETGQNLQIDLHEFVDTGLP